VGKLSDKEKKSVSENVTQTKGTGKQGGKAKSSLKKDLPASEKKKITEKAHLGKKTMATLADGRQRKRRVETSFELRKKTKNGGGASATNVTTRITFRGNVKGGKKGELRLATGGKVDPLGVWGGGVWGKERS